MLLLFTGAYETLSTFRLTCQAQIKFMSWGLAKQKAGSPGNTLTKVWLKKQM